MRSIRPLPPRGMMTSMYSGMAIMAPTAARSVVATTWTASAGSPAVQPPADAVGDGLIGGEGLGAAPQHRGVAGLEAESGGIRRHVGPGLVDDADDPERHPHAPHLDARGAVVEVGDGAHRVRQGGDLAQPLDHGVDAPGGQLEAVQQGRVQTLGAPPPPGPGRWRRRGPRGSHRWRPRWRSGPDPWPWCWPGPGPGRRRGRAGPGRPCRRRCR